MSLIIPIHQIQEIDKGQVGGKAFALAISSQSGMNVPGALCV